jgi:hypothetical protein
LPRLKSDCPPHCEAGHTGKSTHAFAFGPFQAHIAVRTLAIGYPYLRQAGYGLCPVLVSKYRASPISSRTVPGTQYGAGRFLRATSRFALKGQLSVMRSYFYMQQNNKFSMKLLVPLLWMLTGFLSWYLSIYLFSYILSPVLINVVRKTNAITESIFMKNMANMLFTKVADFTLCFIIAALLSFFTQSTNLRLSLFIIGAIAITLVVQVANLINYIRIYSELPSWAVTSELQGFISIVLIIPLLSFVGSKIGNYLKSRRY